jgi:nucleotide-binding universal stress UspA family protein
MTTILVAHDFSPCADAALREAAKEARLFSDARLVVAHVVPIQPIVGGGFDFGANLAGAQVEIENALLVQGEQQLKRIVDVVRAANPGLTIETRCFVGFPAPAIAALATEIKADRIVVGTHGRQGLEHFFVGSVAEHVLREAHVPVVVVRAPRT